MKKKKIILPLLLMSLSLVACGNESKTTETITQSSESSSVVTTENVTTESTSTEVITEEKTESSTSYNSKAEELVNGISKLQSNHKDEVMNLMIYSTYEFAEERSTGEFDMSNVPEDAPGNYEAPVKMETVVYKIESKGEYKYSSKIYVCDIKSVIQSDSISTAKEQSYIDVDNKLQYYYDDDKWVKQEILQDDIEMCSPFSNFSIDMFESYDIQETDKEYIVTGKTKVNKLNSSITYLVGSLGVTGSSANVDVEIKFDKTTNEVKYIDYLIENTTDSDVELKNTELIIDNIHFTNETLEIPEDIIKNAK